MLFGWRKKADQLRMVLLVAGHPLAKELAPGLREMLDAFRDVAKGSADASARAQEVWRRVSATPLTDAERPLWEPMEIHDWAFQATFYRVPNHPDQLWWLVRASHENEQPPTDKEIAWLDKILEYLGADPVRDLLCGPRTPPPPGSPRYPFGWWSWLNRDPLFEIHIHPTKTGRDHIRYVPAGTRPSDGYVIDRVTKPSVD